MKKILIISALMGLGSYANAKDVGILESSVTVNQVTIASHTATAVTTTSTLMKDRTSILLQNMDTSNNIFCDFNSVALSSTTHSFMIPLNGGVFYADMRGFGIWCITEKLGGTSKLTVVQGY